MRGFSVKLPQAKSKENSRGRLFASLGGRMHMEMSQKQFDARILREKCHAPRPGQPFCASRIFRKNAGEQMQHPDQAPALTLTVRTPQCGHSV